MQLTRSTKIAIAVASACAIYSAGGFWGVPALIKWAAKGPVSETLGRAVQIEKAEFNPWTLEATAHNLSMAAAKGDEPALTVGKIYLNAGFIESIKRFGVVVQSAAIDQLNTSLVIGQGNTTNFDDIISRFTQQDDKSKPEPEDKDAKPFPFCVNNIELTNSHLLVSAPSMGVHEDITQINLAIPFIGTIGSDVDKLVEPKLTFLDNGSPFLAQGETLPFKDSIATKLHAEINGYDLAHLAGMIPVPLKLNVTSGTVSVAADLLFAQATKNSARALSLTGQASADNVAVSMAGEQGKNNAVAFEKLAVDLNELDLVNNRANVKSITLTAPKVSAERMPDGSLAWASVVQAKPATATAAEPKKDAAGSSASSGFDWVVGKVALTQGQVQFLDHAAADTKLTAEQLEAGLENVTMRPGERSSFKVDARTLQGALSLAGTMDLADLKVNAKVRSDKLNLAPLSAYAEPAGAKFAGILSTQLDVSANAKSVLQAAVKGTLGLGELSVDYEPAKVSAKAQSFAVNELDLAWNGQDSSVKVQAAGTSVGNLAGKTEDIDFSLAQLNASGLGFSQGSEMLATLKSANVSQASATVPVNAARVTVLTQDAALTDAAFKDGSSGYTRLGSAVSNKIAFEIAGLKTQFGGVDQVAVAQVDAPAQGTISIQSVKIDKPRYKVSKDAKGNLDIDPLLGKRESAEKAKQVREHVKEKAEEIQEKAGRDPDRPIRIGEIAVTNGFLGFTDNSIRPAGEFRCGDVNVSVKPLAIGGQDTPSTLDVSALVNGVSKIQLTGKGSPLADKGKLTAKGSVTAVSMPYLSPYTLHYTSYPIKRGNLSVTADVTLTDKSKLSVDNHVTIERLEWGPYIPNATSSSLPVTLASAILTDSKGNVDFGLPISGDLADPSFSISEVVLIALRNLIVKVAASPVNLLTSLASFGLDAGATKSVLIPFVTGQAHMGDEQKAIAKPIVEALKKNPTSKLEVTPVVAIKGEDQEVHRRTYEGMLKIAQSTLPAQKRSREAAVDKVFAMILPKENQSLSTQEKEQKLYAAVKPDINTIINMANARAKSFSRMLVQNGIDESRLFLSAPEIDKKGTSGGVKVSLLK